MSYKCAYWFDHVGVRVNQSTATANAEKKKN